MQITTQLSGSRIIFFLILIIIISLGLKLYTVDFSIPPHSDDFGYIVNSMQYNQVDFFLSQKKHPGWSLVLAPFTAIVNSDNFLDYGSTARILSIAISTITIIPMYILARRFFDEKYSLVAASLFAFEPHLNYNAVLGLSEPIFVLGIILTTIFILQKNHSWYFYLSFLLAGIVWWIRFNGLIMVVILSIVFFVIYKPSSKNFLKYLVCIGLFLIIVSPILIQRYDQFGEPLYFAVSDNHFIGDSYANYAVNTMDIEYSASDYIEENGILNFVERFGLMGLYTMATHMFKMLFPYLIFLVPFGVLFSLRAFVPAPIIKCSLNIDGTGKNKISTNIGFFDHMLEIFSTHSLIDIKLKAEGDVKVDFHHTIEDCGYVLGNSIKKALGDKRGINRYGFYYTPMDECLSRSAVDFSGRSELVWDVKLGLKKIGSMDTELFEEFFKAFSKSSEINLHIKNLYGSNNHHIIESCFKAFARSVRMALEVDKRITKKIPSSKGTL